MGNNTSKTEKAAGCGCLIGILLGVVYAVMTMFSGMRGNPAIFLIIIPLFGIFGASIPMSIFSPDKSIRRGSGCICYPVLIIVGMMMLSPIIKIPFNDYSEALPAFLCMILMPLTYSIADGIIIGFISYVVINLLCGKVNKISVSMYIMTVLLCFKFFI